MRETRRRLHEDAGGTVSTEEVGPADGYPDGGVAVMRMSEASGKPSTVVIPWEALAGLALDLARRVGDRR